jgi:hypothetical protein
VGALPLHATANLTSAVLLLSVPRKSGGLLFGLFQPCLVSSTSDTSDTTVIWWNKEAGEAPPSCWYSAGCPGPDCCTGYTLQEDCCSGFEPTFYLLTGLLCAYGLLATCAGEGYDNEKKSIYVALPCTGLVGCLVCGLSCSFSEATAEGLFQILFCVFLVFTVAYIFIPKSVCNLEWESPGVGPKCLAFSTILPVLILLCVQLYYLSNDWTFLSDCGVPIDTVGEIADPDGWYFSKGGESCDQACSDVNLLCDELQQSMHNTEVDSAIEMDILRVHRSALVYGGQRCQLWRGGTSPDAPIVHSGGMYADECFYSKPERHLRTFQCGYANSHSNAAAGHRLCYCVAQSTLDDTAAAAKLATIDVNREAAADWVADGGGVVWLSIPDCCADTEFNVYLLLAGIFVTLAVGGCVGHSALKEHDCFAAVAIAFAILPLFGAGICSISEGSAERPFIMLITLIAAVVVIAGCCDSERKDNWPALLMAALVLMMGLLGVAMLVLGDGAVFDTCLAPTGDEILDGTLRPECWDESTCPGPNCCMGYALQAECCSGFELIFYIVVEALCILTAIALTALEKQGFFAKGVTLACAVGGACFVPPLTACLLFDSSMEILCTCSVLLAILIGLGCGCFELAEGNGDTCPSVMRTCGCTLPAMALFCLQMYYVVINDSTLLSTCGDPFMYELVETLPQNDPELYFDCLDSSTVACRRTTDAGPGYIPPELGSGVHVVEQQCWSLTPAGGWAPTWMAATGDPSATGHDPARAGECDNWYEKHPQKTCPGFLAL